MIDAKQILEQIKSLDLLSLKSMATSPDKVVRMVENLHIDNPFVADLVQVWLNIRSQRMEFEQEVAAKVAKVAEELAKFQ